MPVAATLLSITGAGFAIPDAAARGLTMTIAPIGQAVQMDRTINGELIDLAQPQFAGKFQVVVSGGDVQSPALSGVAPGTAVTVVCIPGLGKDTEDAPLTLQMRVGAWSEQRDEWGAASSWSLPLESV